MKKYDIKKLNKDSKEFKSLGNAVFEYLSEVDPEFLSQLSEMVDKKLEAKKDTEDYNFDLVSDLLDKTAQMFMTGGQDSFSPGDVLKVSEQILELKGENGAIEDLINALADGDYEKYPFSLDIANELRAKFLLKTSQDDTFKDLMHEVDQKMTSYMKKEDWKKIKKAIKNAEKRIFSEDLNFLNPPEGMAQGDLMPLDAKEAAQYGLSDGVVVDKRKDNHDLLSLKELSLILKGENVDPLTIAPGFFAKYMPELNKEGIYAITFKVVDGVLKEIKPTPIYNKGNYSYSPITAAIGLLHTHGAKIEEVDKTIGEGKWKKTFKTHSILEKYEPEKVIKDGERYYVVVSGCIASPSKMTPINYEEQSNNNKRVLAGETFLFERQEGKILCTRIHFMPYKPSELNLVFQTGSVVFGSNDQSLHSCVVDPNSFGPLIADNYKDWYRETEDERYSEGITAARVNHFIEGTSEDIFRGGPLPQTPEQWERDGVLGDVCLSVAEVSPFTMFYYLKSLHRLMPKYGYINDHLGEFLKHYAPLTKRFLLKKYVEEKTGITVEYQPTFYKRLGLKFKSSQGLKIMKDMGRMEEVKKLVEKDGLTYEKAIKKVYPAGEAEEKIKQIVK